MFVEIINTSVTRHQTLLTSGYVCKNVSIYEFADVVNNMCHNSNLLYKIDCSYSSLRGVYMT